MNGSLLTLRNGVFFSAILLMNYTIGRPSPVDFVFIASLLVSPFIAQKVTVNFFIYTVIVLLWTAAFQTSSTHLLGDRDLRFELIAKTFVVTLSITACYIATSWRRDDWHRFLKIYVISCTIAACLGALGFVTGSELLTWDGRAKGLIDDPNMYSAFLLPGVLSCLYLIKNGSSRFVFGAAMCIIAVGVLCSFSRVAVATMLLTSSAYLAIINRNRLVETGLGILGILALALVLLFVLTLVVPGFEEKLFNRLTFVKSYDAGHSGRYSRYALSLPLILDHPFGIGVNQVVKFFAEPLHNFILGSFLYYGWLAGSCVLLLIGLSVRVAWRAFKATGEPLVMLLCFCLVSIVLCAMVHEAEHWRHMWLFFGLLWGFNPNNFPSRRVIDRPAADMRSLSVAVRA